MFFVQNRDGRMLCNGEEKKEEKECLREKREIDHLHTERI